MFVLVCLFRQTPVKCVSILVLRRTPSLRHNYCEPKQANVSSFIPCPIFSETYTLQLHIIYMLALPTALVYITAVHTWCSQ